MKYITESGEYEIDKRTVQLIQLKHVCRLHIAGLRSRVPITKVGKSLGLKSRTAKGMLKEIETILEEESQW